MRAGLGSVAVLRGEARALPLPDASVDAVICDPPYALTELSTYRVVEAITAWTRGHRMYVPIGTGGFMGRSWDGFVPPPGAWDECMRVLKPGGHVAAFAGSRTADLMGLSIRFAGFEIRDSLAWIYGQGFPKSLDVGKAIDAAAGAERPTVGVAADFARDGARRDARGAHVIPHSQQGGHGFGDRWATPITAPATDAARRWDGWGTALKPAFEPIILARRPLDGTVAANVQAHGTGAINIDACRIPGTQENARVNKGGYLGYRGGDRPDKPWSAAAGRWPTNVVLTHGDCTDQACAPGCPVADLDQQSGTRRAGGDVTGDEPSAKHQDIYSGIVGRAPFVKHRDSGGASRFFPVFRWQAKAPAAERPRLPDGTAWPTVKPVALMRWLVRLLTPPGGVVLDPFAGTGTTGEAARAEGFRCVLIDQDDTAVQLAMRRLTSPPGERNRVPAPAPGVGDEMAPVPSDVQLDLFGGAA